MATELTKEFLSAIEIAESIGSKMLVLGHHQLKMDHKAYFEVFGGLKNLITNTWCEVVYDGAAWYLAAYGTL